MDYNTITITTNKKKNQMTKKNVLYGCGCKKPAPATTTTTTTTTSK